MGSFVAIAALFLVGYLILNAFKNSGLTRNSDTKGSGNTFFFNDFNSDGIFDQSGVNGDNDSHNQDNDCGDCGCDSGGSDACDGGCDCGCDSGSSND